MSRTLAANCGSLDRLNCRTRCGCNPGLRQMRCTELTLMPLAWAMATAVQCVVSPGGSVNVSATSHTDKAARSLRPTSLLRNGGPSYSEDPGLEILQHGEARLWNESVPGRLRRPC